MSYSRWGSSRFYTMWACTKETETGKKADQVFEIMELGNGITITYGEMIKDLDAVLEKVKEHYSQEHKASLLKEIHDGDFSKAIYEETTVKAYPLTEADELELRSYMLRFMEDVKNDKEFE